jgi:endogenous inhibitor of DNA gyrase (YacG/DUF329 family)
MPRHTCPSCGKEFAFQSVAEHQAYPFCSERCRLADLGAWFDGRYVVSRPAAEESADAPEEDAPPAGPASEPPPAPNARREKRPTRKDR